MINQLNDNDLLARISRGDSAAFIELYDRYAGRVYALTWKMLRDPMLAEEVTQDAFLKLWARARQFIPERGSALVWLLTITRHTALDRIRLEARRPALSDSAESDDAWLNIPDPRSTSEEHRWQSMYLIVNSLPPEQRQVIDLAYYQGLSQSEIAEMLGWPLGTVKTRLRAALEKLRQTWNGS